MTVYYANEQAQRADVPPRLPGNEGVGGRIRGFRATIPLDAPKTSSTANGAGITTSDTVVLFTIPPGYRFWRGFINASVSLGTSTVAVGNASSAGKYRAAGTFTNADTPLQFAAPALTQAAPARTTAEDVILSVATANLPTTAGAVLVIDMEFIGP